MTLRIDDLDDPRWLALFRGVRESWFRLETLQEYVVDYEARDLDEFLRTGNFRRVNGPWQEMIAEHVNAGRQLRRVHVVEQPLTGYLRYELAAYEQNAAAGEEIRLLATAAGTWPPDLPRGEDFWIFDDRTAWAMNYDPAGRFVAAEEVTDPNQLARYRRWRTVALAQSIPLNEFTRNAA